MRTALVLSLTLSICSCSTATVDKIDQIDPGSPWTVRSVQKGEFKLAFWHPSEDLVLSGWERSFEVQGGASVFGGVRHLDLMLVLDTSKSLQKTDPRNYRTRGALGLVESLPPLSDIQLGVVDFDSSGELILPLTKDRQAVAAALRRLNQRGRTDLAAGIRTALAEFQRNARPGSTRAILLFTDGKSDREEALQAMHEARSRGIALNALLAHPSRAIGREECNELLA